MAICRNSQEQHTHIVAFLLLTTAIFPTTLLAADFTGLVVSVLEGDTSEVLHNQHPERIRLHGIDCPEKGQAYGQQAKQAISDLAFKQEVIIRTHGKDS